MNVVSYRNSSVFRIYLIHLVPKTLPGNVLPEAPPL